MSPSVPSPLDSPTPRDALHRAKPIAAIAHRQLPLILLASLLARLPGLASKPLWYDEAFAVLFSSKGPQAMIAGTLAIEEGIAADVHPLLYYTVLWGWGSVLSTSPPIVRSLSVILGVILVWLGYRLALRMFGAATAVVSGWLLALSPFQIHYAQEVRMYALLGLLLIGAAWSFRVALDTQSIRSWLSFALLSAGAQYTHNLAALFLLPLSLTSLGTRDWKAIRNTLLAGLLAIGLYFPWLVRLPTQLARVQTAYWIEVPDSTQIVRTLLTFVSGLPLPQGTLPLGLFSAVFILIVGAYATLLGWRKSTPGTREAIWAGYMAFMPAALMFVISQWQPIYLDRALLPSGVLFLIWTAWVLTASPLKEFRPLMWTMVVFILAAMILGLAGYYTYRGFPYAPYRELDAFLQENVESSEAVVHSNKITALPAAYYADEFAQEYLQDPPGSGSDTLAKATQRVLGLRAKDTIEEAVGSAEGIWFVFFPSEIQDYEAAGYAEHPALSHLQSSFTLEKEYAFGELRVMHFQP